MAIWSDMLKRVIQPILDDSNRALTQENAALTNKINDLEKAVFVSAIPMGGFSPMINPASGKVFPQRLNFQILRDFSSYYPIARACINYRKRQITQLDWSVTPIEVELNPDKKKKLKEKGKEVKMMLEYPLGDKTMTFRDFITRILEDLLVLDALAIYRRKNRVGGIYGYQPIDASTIQLMVYEDGTTPAPPDPAYVQTILGRKTAELTTDELIYRSMNGRTNTPYGMSPIETLIITITTALKLSTYNLGYLTEGNTPEGFVELPKDIAGSPDQLRQWQEAWDAMFSGDPRYQRKLKFLPEGMKLHPFKKPDEMQFERFEKWLLQNACSVLEVAPQAIGFQFERGKGATESEWEIGKERGLFPTANILKEILDQIIQHDLGYTDLEFVWTNINPTNQADEAKVFDTLVRTGAVSVDEWRLGEGLEPIGLPNYIMSPVGPILVKDLLEQSERGFNTTQPFNPSGQPNPPVKASATYKDIKQPKKDTQNTGDNAFQDKKPDQAQSDESKKIASTIGQSASRAVVVDELKRWKKAAINDMKLGRSYRDFKTDVIDIRTQRLIKSGLSTVQAREELDQLFDPFISQENQMITAMLDLYDNVNNIIGKTNGKRPTA